STHLLILLYSSLPAHATLRCLPSFPTRRSSDLRRFHHHHRRLVHGHFCPAPSVSFFAHFRPLSSALSSQPVLHPPGELERRERRSEEHTSELQSRFDLVCRLLLEKIK